MLRSVACSVGIALSLFTASCTGADLEMDEAALTVDAGVEGGIATSPSYIPIPCGHPDRNCDRNPPKPPPVAPPNANIGGGGDCDTPDEAERNPECGGGGGGVPDATFCQLYPSWCPPPPRNPLPPRTPCSLLDPCTPPVAPVPTTYVAPAPAPELAVDLDMLEFRADELAEWAAEVDTEEAWEIAGLAADVADEANIIVPPGGGCPNESPDFCGPHDDEGGGGSGTGGGTGGGGTGGGGSTPPGMTCPSGWRYSSWLGYCVAEQWGEECANPVGGREPLSTCYFAQNGQCRAFRHGGDCRCQSGYRWIRNHDQPNPTGPQAYVCYNNDYPDPWPNDLRSAEQDESSGLN